MANLSQITLNAVKTAMRLMGDLKKPITYTRVVPGVYDPESDSTNEETVSRSFDAAVVGLSEDEHAWIATDRKGAKLLIARSDLPDMPLITDYVTFDGERWEVIRLKRVPGDSVWIVIVQGG